MNHIDSISGCKILSHFIVQLGISAIYSSSRPLDYSRIKNSIQNALFVVQSSTMCLTFHNPPIYIYMNFFLARTIHMNLDAWPYLGGKLAAHAMYNLVVRNRLRDIWIYRTLIRNVLPYPYMMMLSDTYICVIKNLIINL